MDLKTAQALVGETLSAARQLGLKPLAVAVFDRRGALRAVAVEDDAAGTKRAEIAMGKGNAAIAMGLGTRDIGKRPAHFLAAVTHAAGGLFVPVPGGVLVRDGDGYIIGAVGVSGDTSDNDEAAALQGIAAVGLAADPG